MTRKNEPLSKIKEMFSLKFYKTYSTWNFQWTSREVRKLYCRNSIIPKFFLWAATAAWIISCGNIILKIQIIEKLLHMQIQNIHNPKSDNTIKLGVTLKQKYWRYVWEPSYYCHRWCFKKTSEKSSQCRHKLHQSDHELEISFASTDKSESYYFPHCLLLGLCQMFK